MDPMYILITVCFAIGFALAYPIYSRFATCMIKVQGNYSGGRWGYVSDIDGLSGCVQCCSNKRYAMLFDGKKAALSYSDVLKDNGVTRIKIVHHGPGYYLASLGSIESNPDDYNELMFFFLLPAITVGGLLSLFIYTTFFM